MPLISVTAACAVSVLLVEAHRLCVHAASRRALPTAQSAAGLVTQGQPLAPPHGPFPQPTGVLGQEIWISQEPRQALLSRYHPESCGPQRSG